MLRKDKVYKIISEVFQLMWVFIFWWGLPMGLLYAFVPDAYNAIFEGHLVAKIAIYSTLPLLMLSLIGSLLITHGDARYLDTPREWAIYSVICPFYPFYSGVKSWKEFVKTFRSLRADGASRREALEATVVTYLEEGASRE